MTKSSEAELASMCEAIGKEHAAQIIDFLEILTNGNLPECLDVAAQQYQDTQSSLWLAVSSGIEVLIRQNNLKSAEREISVTNDNGVPF